MRKGFKKRIDTSVIQGSSKESDGKLLKEFSCTSEYKADEFAYLQEKLESKYDFKFKSYYKRAHAVEEWEKIKESLSVVQKTETKKPVTSKKKIKPKTIKDEDWSKTSVQDLSPSQALERFYKLKAEEKRQRLLEEVRNVELLW